MKTRSEATRAERRLDRLVGRHPAILSCPFCGHKPDDLDDALHPTGTGWSDGPGKRRYYFGRQHARYKDRDGDVWELGCLEHEGGCGATMTGDSEAQVIAKWNSRWWPLRIVTVALIMFGAIASILFVLLMSRL